MCIIVDANRASDVFGPSPATEMLPLATWILSGSGGHLVYGGQLLRELARVNYVPRVLQLLQRRGRATDFGDAVDDDAAQLRSRCLSDDPHVIALARASGARTLCTSDRRLIRDFRNRDLIANPRGFIYSKASHAHLLKHTRSCGKLRKPRPGDR